MAVRGPPPAARRDVRDTVLLVDAERVTPPDKDAPFLGPVLTRRVPVVAHKFMEFCVGNQILRHPERMNRCALLAVLVVPAVQHMVAWFAQHDLHAKTR